MIYDFPDSSSPINQGDIFFGIPRLEISLNNIIVADEDGERVVTWNDIASSNEPVSIIASVRPVIAIVATQNCDASRSRDITLCEISLFKDVELKCKETSSSKSWVNIITQHARINQKWFYLPPNEELGFSEKMAVDFMVTLRVPRADLEDMRNLRKGRLNSIADEHFRERISEFFRRYPYDEWYSLNQSEFDIYNREHPGTPPFPYQATDV